MKREFNVFDALSSGSKDTAAPTMHFAKTGVISLNGAAVNLLGLKAGDQIKFFQNKRDPKEWFFKTDDGGFVVRKAYDKKCKGLMLNNAFTCKSIIQALGLSNGFKCRIGKEPDADGLWSLITSAVK